jgi:hypothetical protein
MDYEREKMSDFLKNRRRNPFKWISYYLIKL